VLDAAEEDGRRARKKLTTDLDSLTAWFQINWAPDLEKFQAEDQRLYTGGISTGGWLSHPPVETISTGGWLSRPPVLMHLYRQLTKPTASTNVFSVYLKISLYIFLEII